MAKRTNSKQLFKHFYLNDQLLQLLLVAIRMSNIITTENTPVRRIDIEWHLIINMAFTIFLPELDILDGSLFSVWLPL